MRKPGNQELPKPAFSCLPGFLIRSLPQRNVNEWSWGLNLAVVCVSDHSNSYCKVGAAKGPGRLEAAGPSPTSRGSGHSRTARRHVRLPRFDRHRTPPRAPRGSRHINRGACARALARADGRPVVPAGICPPEEEVRLVREESQSNSRPSPFGSFLFAAIVCESAGI
jgi:hypothetical protein